MHFMVYFQHGLLNMKKSNPVIDDRPRNFTFLNKVSIPFAGCPAWSLV
jgi:hypothetical protein